MASTKAAHVLRPAELVLQFDQLDDLKRQAKELADQITTLNDKLIQACQAGGEDFRTIEATTAIWTLTEPQGTTYDDEAILGVLKPGQLKAVTARVLDHKKFLSALEIGYIKRETVALFITAKEIAPSFRRTVKATAAA